MARIDIVLIEPDANALWIDLYEFAERILQTAADGDGAAQSRVIFREFLTADGAGGIDTRARFIDDHVRHFREFIADQFGDEFFRFPAGSPVADGDDVEVMLL